MRTIALGLYLVLIGVMLFSAGPAAAEEAKAMAELRDANGAVVGTIHLAQEGSQVHIVGEVSNLPAGEHGFHIHAVGSCSPDFGAAGGHFNPEGKQHGLWNSQGHHAGDLPNLMVGDTGNGTYDYKTAAVTLLSGANSLFDSDGSALVVHAGADDYMTDPTGNSGGRIACGVIQLVQPAPSPTPEAQPLPTPALPLPETGIAEQPGSGVAEQPASLPNTAEAGGRSTLPLLMAAGLVLVLGALLRHRSGVQR